MNLLSLLLVFTFLPIGLSFAQNTPTNQAPVNTGTISTTVTSNRRQELYDQYHSYSNKAGNSSNTSSGTSTNNSTATNSPVNNPNASSTTAKVDEPRQPMSPEGSPLSKFRIGIRGGVTYPVFLEKPAGVGIDPALGFVGGVTFNFGTGTLSFQPEINYVRDSYKLSVVNFSSTYAFDQIQVPLLLKISSGSYAGSRFFVNVGPYASYLISASVDGKKYSVSGDKGRFGFGGALGIGAAVKAGPGHVTIEVRGLYPLGDTDGGFSTDSRTIFGQGTLGYIFPLGR